MEYLFLFIKIGVIIGVLLSFCAGCVMLERRLSAFIQDRLGPNRVGPQGILQPLADLIKFLFKEDIVPDKSSNFLYIIAPILTFVPPLISFAVIPFGVTSWVSGESLAIADIGVSVLFFLAISSLNTYGLAFGGWASFSKYSFMGSLRASAQIISFEIAMGLVIVSLVMSVGSLDLNVIVRDQQGVFLGFLPNWFCFRQPLAFILFIITAFAETNRLPFDMPESEPDLVGGFHTEYSSIKFSLFFLGEYSAMITMSGIIVTLFLGGWSLPGLEVVFPSEATNPFLIAVLSIGIFLVKLFAVLFLFIWVRWSLPRVRWDQLMYMGWARLIPLALLNIFLISLFGLI